MAAAIQIKTTFGNNQTLDKFREILALRMQYMNESARGSVSACAIDVLRSIRAVTKVAKPSKIKVQVEEDTSIRASVSTKGKLRTFTIRYSGSNLKYAGNETVVNRMPKGMKNDSYRLFRFTDEFNKKSKSYIIVAPNISSAKKIAKEIVTRRAMKYSGLAKRAIGVLMFKTNTKKVNDGRINPGVELVANDNTRKVETVKKSDNGNSIYSLTLHDDLRYALDAIRGGKSMVDIAMKKAMNKIVSIINRKIQKKGFLDQKKIDVPFPELRKRSK